MAVGAFRSRWRQGWRVVAYSAAAGIAFVALERIELALFDLVGADKLVASTRSEGADARLAAEAEALAARSQARLAALPPGHRGAAFRLGYELGWASEFVGSFAMSDPAVQARAKAIGDAHVAAARDAARRIGIDGRDIAALPSRTLTDFVRVQERFERDESGIAARVDAQLTPIHRELFMFGTIVGADTATVEGSNGKLGQPSVEAIRRHATLAGVAAETWQPLVVDPRGVAPDVVVARQRAAVETVLSALAARDADDAARR
jgi:hypothetical protein